MFLRNAATTGTFYETGRCYGSFELQQFHYETSYKTEFWSFGGLLVIKRLKIRSCCKIEFEHFQKVSLRL